MKVSKKYLDLEPSDIITKTGNELFIDGKKLTREEIRLLSEEIGYIKRSAILKILTNNLVSTAKEMMFEKAQTFDDMIKGKMILYTIDIQEKIMKLIEDTNAN